MTQALTNRPPVDSQRRLCKRTALRCRAHVLRQLTHFLSQLAGEYIGHCPAEPHALGISSCCSRPSSHSPTAATPVIGQLHRVLRRHPPSTMGGVALCFCPVLRASPGRAETGAVLRACVDPDFCLSKPEQALARSCHGPVCADCRNKDVETMHTCRPQSTPPLSVAALITANQT